MTVRRGLGFVLALIGLAVFVSVAGLVVIYVSIAGGMGMGRSSRVPSSAVLVLRPDPEPHLGCNKFEPATS